MKKSVLIGGIVVTTIAGVAISKVLMKHRKAAKAVKQQTFNGSSELDTTVHYEKDGKESSMTVHRDLARALNMDFAHGELINQVANATYACFQAHCRNEASAIAQAGKIQQMCKGTPLEQYFPGSTGVLPGGITPTIASYIGLMVDQLGDHYGLIEEGAVETSSISVYKFRLNFLGNADFPEVQPAPNAA